MYIQPNSDLYLLNNVPLDDTYDHTLYFASASAQSSYFLGRRKYSLTGQSYQRVNKGVARVGVLADNLYDVNYIMFRNTAFGTKWFYAFVKKIEYVNNNCSDVYYEMDVLQTWHFDYNLDDCFVVRQHTTTDNIGDNINPEPLAIPECVTNGYHTVTYGQEGFGLSDMAVIIAIVDTNNETSGTLYDGIYGSAQLFAYSDTDIDGINAKVNEYVQKPDAIIGMYMLPEKIIAGGIPSDHQIKIGSRARQLSATLDTISTSDTLNGYKPKNNKLYTYPYNFIQVDDGLGSTLPLRYEFFSNHTARVLVEGTITQPVSIVLRPYNYKNSQSGSAATYPTLNTEMISLGNFPLCSWNVDSYQAWVAQNTLPIVIGGAKTVGGIIGQALTGNIGGAIMTAFEGVTGPMQQDYQASIAADQSRGSLSNGGPNVASGKCNFFWARMSVPASVAVSIDDFFTRFGYAMNRLTTPNRSARPHWNYVKTAGCTVTGSVPADDMRKICGIYDVGVTWWKNPAEIGNYSLDNSP